MTPTLPELLSRVEAATGPDREIDALICVALRDVPDARHYKLGARPNSSAHTDWRVDLVLDTGVVRSRTPAPYTASIDAALALMERALPGWGVEVLTSGREGWGAAQVWYGERRFSEGNGEPCYARTATLAILAAILTAMEAPTSSGAGGVRSPRRVIRRGSKRDG